MTKEIPILFSTPMVQAILAGRKTQTRRVIKMDDLLESPDRFVSAGDSREWDVPRPAIKYDDRIWFAWQPKNSNARTWIERCKYKPGDLLWVRESVNKGQNGQVHYKADELGPLNEVRWTPSIHMPKAAARIWLEVTNVRVERLQDISEDDAVAEGTGSGFQMNAGWPDYTQIKNGICEVTQDSARMSYATLWESINGPESWEANSWVWVVEFKVLSTTGKPVFKNIKHINA